MLCCGVVSVWSFLQDGFNEHHQGAKGMGAIPPMIPLPEVAIQHFRFQPVSAWLSIWTCSFNFFVLDMHTHTKTLPEWLEIWKPGLEASCEMGTPKTCIVEPCNQERRTNGMAAFDTRNWSCLWSEHNQDFRRVLYSFQGFPSNGGITSTHCSAWT